MKIKTIILIILDFLALCGFLLFYGPFDSFKSWYVNTAVNTMSHRYFAYIFYSEKMVNEIVNSNYSIPPAGETNLDEIIIDTEEKDTYENEYEKQILERDKDNKEYKILNVKVGNYTAVMAVIYDPSQIRILKANVLGTGGVGENVKSMCERNGATICLSGAGGQVNAQDYTTNIPEGAIIQDGEIAWSRDNSRVGPYVGFTNDNKLLLAYDSPTGLLGRGVRDAIQWWPFLIVNGESMKSIGNGGFGNAARAVIAQRKDGVVLFLATNATYAYGGPTLDQVVSVLEKYGAYNAANLDGGTSVQLVEKGKLLNTLRNIKQQQISGRGMVSAFGFYTD